MRGDENTSMRTYRAWPRQNRASRRGGRLSYASRNAFQSLKLKGLTSTAELRAANERARIRQSMSAATAVPDENTRLIERLLSDPNYRIREAAAWYFDFGPVEDALVANPIEMAPHDRTLVLWQSVRKAQQEASSKRAEGRSSWGLDAYSDASHSPLELFEEALDATTELLNNPAAWESLVRLFTRSPTCALMPVLSRAPQKTLPLAGFVKVCGCWFQRVRMQCARRLT